MSNSVKYRITKIISLILISVIAIYNINSILFVHTHTLENGSTIVHSHPYNKSDESKQKHHHSHSQNELISLEKFKHIFIFILYLLLLFTIVKGTELPELFQYNFNRPFLNQYSTRSPPLIIT